MDLLLSTFPLLAPAALVLVAVVARLEPGRDPRRVLAMARAASVVGVAVAVATALRVALVGPVTTPAIGVGDATFALRLDALSAVMLGLVAFMGAVLLRYSRSYLGGDDGHGEFMGRLALTVACVMLLVMSGSLLHLTVFWALTSFALHRLLLFYPDRPAAVIAARKKFLVARAGDLALGLAAILLYQTFGTGDLILLLERAAEVATTGQPAGNAVLTATLLVALSAALKSAMFPTHGWLAEVMETPTPVSALLHAGIINGGTFLVVRLADVMLLSAPALHFLLVIGGFTAIYASVVMVTQSSVKVALAYSSAAHMGFMLLLCGLGAWPVAILHLVAHSFYKAHAFLSSGSAVETKGTTVPPPVEVPGLGRILVGIGASLATVVGVAAVLGVSIAEKPVALGLSAILAIGLTQLWVRGAQQRPSAFVLGRSVAAAAATTLAFFTLELGAARILAGAVPETVASGTTLALMTAVVALFALVVLIQLRLPVFARTPTGRALWVHLRNGLYANALFDRLVGALRVPDTLTSSYGSRG